MDKWLESIHIALENLMANKIRSLLSILGVVIGIGAVVVVLAVSAGARADILESVNEMGVNVVMVMPDKDAKSRRAGEIELADIENIRRLPFVEDAFPTINKWEDVRTRLAGGRSVVSAVTETYLITRRFHLLTGRNFSPLELEARARVCLINRAAAETFFKHPSPLNQVLFMNGHPWTVIGVFDKDNRKSNGPNKDEERSIVLTPLNTFLRLEENLNLSAIEIHVKPGNVNLAVKEVMAAMERGDEKRKGLFRVWNQQDLIDRKIEVEKTLSAVVMLVACVSLLVGGIGMMNVMLTSVAERTREIGLRRAIGARRKDILFQFLVESAVLSVLGGVFGLMGGAAFSRSVPIFLPNLFSATPVLRPTFALLSVMAAVVLGLVFGLYPAIKASRLPASEALRSE